MEKNEKHFKLTDETLVYVGHTLHRIECIKEFRNQYTTINVGDKGGWIEKEDNLSDDAWVYEEARVCGDAKVYGNARVCDNAQVYGNARVCDNAQVYGEAKVYDNARVYGNAEISGDVRICGDVGIRRYLFNSTHGKISCDNDYIVFCNVGSRHDNLTAYRTIYDGVRLNVGCFEGSIDEFQKQVLKKHKNNTLVKNEYLLIIDIIKNRFDINI